MNTRPTIIALLIAVASVILAVTLGDLPTIEVGVGTTDESFLGDQTLDLERVTRITLQREDDAVPLIWERTEAQWNQTSPFEHPMVPYSMRQYMIQANAMMTSGNVNEDAALSPAELGFDPALATITFEDDAGKSVSIELGRRGVAGRAYARRAGEESIAVVSKGLHDRIFDLDPIESRDPRLFPDVSVNVDRIDRRVGDQVMDLVQERKRWAMAAPAETRVDAGLVAQYIESLARSRASSFIRDEPDDLMPYGLAEPVATLTITSSVTRLEGDMPVRESIDTTLLLGAGCGGGTQDRFAMIEGRPTVLRLSKATIDEIFMQPELLVDSTGTDVNAADIRLVRIDGPDGDFRMERFFELGSDRWKAIDHDNVAADIGAIERLIQALTQVRAGGVQFGPYPEELNMATITLYGMDRRAIDTIRVALDPATGNWALENGDGVLRIFPPGLDLALTPAKYGLNALLDSNG